MPEIKKIRARPTIQNVASQRMPGPKPAMLEVTFSVAMLLEKQV